MVKTKNHTKLITMLSKRMYAFSTLQGNGNIRKD